MIKDRCTRGHPIPTLRHPVLASLLLGGCGPSYTYRYSPPPSPHGLACINNCAMQRNHCKQLARLEENSQRALYQAELRAYQYCKDSKPNKNTRHSCPYPSYPFSTPQAPNASLITTAATWPAAAPSSEF